MYHVGSSKRSIDCANMIYSGLCSCVAEKDLNAVTITDIQKKTGIARSSFYRSFDSVDDVLAWKCSLFYTNFLSFYGIDFEKPVPLNKLMGYLIEYYNDNRELPLFMLRHEKTEIMYTQYLEMLKDCRHAININISAYSASLVFQIPLLFISCKQKYHSKDTPEEFIEIVSKELHLIRPVSSDLITSENSNETK